MATPYDIVHLASVHSTQDEAQRTMAASGRTTLVVADRQSGGRGRQGRDWTSPDRGMFASFSFVTDWPDADRTLIPLVAAVAIRRVVDISFDVLVGLRWPNDLMIDGLKVGGILVEASGADIVVGFGMNLWWSEPVEGAQSLLAADPGSSAATSLAESWADILVGLLKGGSKHWPRDEYVTASVTIGHEVSWGDQTGHAKAIAQDGALIVDRQGTLVELRAGEVHTHRHQESAE